LHQTICFEAESQTINGLTITFTYDASGNRISKQLSNGYKEFYVRDASGNVVSIYRSGDANINSGNLTQAEVNLFGSSRLGVEKPNINVQNLVSNTLALSGDFGVATQSVFTRGNKFFDLGDHRNNNLVTIADWIFRSIVYHLFRSKVYHIFRYKVYHEQRRNEAVFRFKVYHLLLVLGLTIRRKVYHLWRCGFSLISEQSLPLLVKA
jgi:hypothetical protein